VRARRTGRLRGHKRIECRILVGKPEGKRHLGRPTHIWKNNIITDPKVI
jgi:hypothetical protein